MDTQEWADRTVSVHEAGGRWEVRLWAGVSRKDDGSWAPGSWMLLTLRDTPEEAEEYRRQAAQVLENALRLSLPMARDGRLTAKKFGLLRSQEGGLT